jgi:hypothetical protein
MKATISLTEEDGSEPLPICHANRSWLVSRYKLEAMIALRFLSDDEPVAEGDKETDRKALDHVRKCPKCRQWIHLVIPSDTLHRQRRLKRYCCAGMFVAVEEADGQSKNRIAFELFRGEDPCWMIDGIRSFASYCPWCGKKLPDKPFVEEP